jgi:hypothetical protein
VSEPTRTDTIEVAGASIARRATRRGVELWGPLPIASSEVIARVRPIDASDRAAVEAGVARRVVFGRPELDEVAFVETELDDDALRALVPPGLRALLAHAIRAHAAVLTIRRRFAHLELRGAVDPALESRLASALAALPLAQAPAARRLDPSSVGPGLAYLGATVGALALLWLHGRTELVSTASYLVLAVASGAGASALFLTARALARWIGRGRTTTHRRARAIAWQLAVPAGLALAVALYAVNEAVPSGPPIERSGSVIAMGCHKAGALAWIELRTEDGRALEVHLRPDRTQPALRAARCDTPLVGTRVRVVTRAGALGLAFVEHVGRVEAP